MPKNRAPETLAVSAAKSNGQQALFRGKKRFFEALRLTRRALESIVSKPYSLADADFSWEISMKKILVAIDNSRYANNVLDFLTSVVAEASEKPTGPDQAAPVPLKSSTISPAASLSDRPA